MPLGLAVAAAIAIADQLAKYWVLAFFAANGVAETGVRVTPFFNLVLTWNRGMSFGLFNNGAALNTIAFTLVAGAIVTGLLVWLHKASLMLLRVAIGLVIGGAVGNVVDRLWRGAVVDFLDFHLGLWHWFAFNLADSAICVGVGLMLLDSLLGRREAPN
jgi:signal peptidase II